MFRSATLQLTGWYLLIIVIVSALFSVTIYQATSTELEARLENYNQGLWRTGPKERPVIMPSTEATRRGDMQDGELREAQTNIIVALVYTNGIILLLGGASSYLLARRTLRPIEEAHLMQARFVGDASHELRTPLAVMTTELEVALRDPAKTIDSLEDVLESNLEEVQKLTRLSHTLLKLSAGEFTSLPRRIFSLLESAEIAISRLNRTAERITLRHPKHLPMVRAQQSSVEELMMILLDNALKYGPGNSSVEVSLSTRGGAVLFAVTNSGPGIPSDALPYVFERFYRAEASRTGNRGYGLGLSLAKQIADLNKGKLSVRSKPGVSTTFTFSLPAAREDFIEYQS